MPLNILIIDDDPSVTSMLEKFLQREGHKAVSVNDPKNVPQAFQTKGLGLILCDMFLGPTTGVRVLKDAQKALPAVPFVVMTAHGSMDVAMDAIRGGAFDFVGKPVDFGQLLRLIRRVEEFHKQLPEVAVSGSAGSGPLIGRSPAMADIYKWIARVSPLDTPVLLRGESGTGKELIAQALHRYGPRTDKPFVPINCAAIPEHLLESELFGHVRGSFTGAVSDKAGLIRDAAGGTLFLDEVGELPIPMQSKMLRVLEDHQVRPVGSDKLYPVDFRLVAATNRNLDEMIRGQTFREDLYYRINGVSMRVPPLRERREDVEILASHYTARLSQKFGREIVLTQAASDVLKGYHWPGNVRELVRELERAAATSPTGILAKEDFAALGGGPETKPAELRSLEDVEREHILAVLRQVGGNKLKAAEILRIDRKTLQRKLQEYGQAPGEPAAP
jgi:DNA-binding NtrC family response regulator